MAPPKWPKLPHTNPSDINEHAHSLNDSFNAIDAFLKAGVCDSAPTLPKGIENKIRAGIEKGLVGLESHHSIATSISAGDRDLTKSAILEQIIAETAFVFRTRVPRYLFRILQESCNELCLKLNGPQSGAPQPSVKAAVENATMPDTPPESPSDETNSSFSGHYGSDSAGLAYGEWIYEKKYLIARANKLKSILQRERRTADQKASIEEGLELLKLERKTARKKYNEVSRAIKERRSEQDKTGDYGSELIGYDAGNSEFYLAKQSDTARNVILKIEKQVGVNRLFKMTGHVLLRKVMDAVAPDFASTGDDHFPSITHFIGAQLLDDGNVELWANSTDEYDFRTSDGDTFNALGALPSWDQAIFASFASHLTETGEPYYTVEVKNVKSVVLQNRKQKAALITDLVKGNVRAIPSLHIDIVKDIRFSRRSSRLELDLLNPAIANEVISHGVEWEGAHHSCEVHDPSFFDRCGCCQDYGHRINTCSKPPRCGKCSLAHYTRVCKSTVVHCALCDEYHKVASSQCRVKRARAFEKSKARFPVKETYPLPALLSQDPKDPNLLSNFTARDLSSRTEQCVNETLVPQEQSVSTTSVTQDQPVPSTPVCTTPRHTAAQIQDQLSALDAALCFSVPNTARGDSPPPAKRRCLGPTSDEV